MEKDTLLANADLLFDLSAIETALDQLAAKLTADYQDKNPLMLCVLNGAMITAGHLLIRLPFKLELNYIHASRYGNKTLGGDLKWKAKPQVELRNRHVILIEDIYDEGLTLTALRQYCEEQGAASVRCVCLVEKDHVSKTGKKPEYMGLTVPDRYVFGFGLDVEESWRNLPGIYAFKES